MLLVAHMRNCKRKSLGVNAIFTKEAQEKKVPKSDNDGFKKRQQTNSGKSDVWRQSETLV